MRTTKGVCWWISFHLLHCVRVKLWSEVPKVIKSHDMTGLFPVHPATRDLLHESSSSSTTEYSLSSFNGKFPLLAPAVPRSSTRVVQADLNPIDKFSSFPHEDLSDGHEQKYRQQPSTASSSASAEQPESHSLSLAMFQPNSSSACAPSVIQLMQLRVPTVPGNGLVFDDLLPFTVSDNLGADHSKAVCDGVYDDFLDTFII